MDVFPFHLETAGRLGSAHSLQPPPHRCPRTANPGCEDPLPGTLKCSSPRLSPSSKRDSCKRALWAGLASLAAHAPVPTAPRGPLLSVFLSRWDRPGVSSAVLLLSWMATSVLAQAPGPRGVTLSPSQTSGQTPRFPAQRCLSPRDPCPRSLHAGAEVWVGVCPGKGPPRAHGTGRSLGVAVPEGRPPL